MSHDYHPLRIARIRRETADTRSLGIEVPEALRSEFRYRPGQHLAVRAMLDGEEVRRTYSISSGPEHKLLWVTVKHVPEGRFSGFVHKSLDIGATIEAMPPAGRFALPDDDGTQKRYVAFAAGSGITPVMAMIEHALARPTTAEFTLIYGNRNVDSVIFRERLDDLKDRHLDRLQVLHVLSRDEEADVPILAGRIDGAKAQALMKGAVEGGVASHAFLCGPDTMIKTVRDALIALGQPRETIHFEYFRAGPESEQRATRPRMSESATPPVGAEVVATLDGVRKTFRVPLGEKVIDSALAAGIKLPYSCKGGMCCTCRAKIVEGKAEMERNFSLEPWEMEKGFVLTCQARPLTDKLVLDYDQV